jgi:hypothetical protein
MTGSLAYRPQPEPAGFWRNLAKVHSSENFIAFAIKPEIHKENVNKFSNFKRNAELNQVPISAPWLG